MLMMKSSITWMCSLCEEHPHLMYYFYFASNCISMVTVYVYWMSTEWIYCSLADAAAGLAYMYLLKAAAVSSPVHVTYVNTWV